MLNFNERLRKFKSHCRQFLPILKKCFFLFLKAYLLILTGKKSKTDPVETEFVSVNI